MNREVDSGGDTPRGPCSQGALRWIHGCPPIPGTLMGEVPIGGGSHCCSGGVLGTDPLDAVTLQPPLSPLGPVGSGPAIGHCGPTVVAPSGAWQRGGRAIRHPPGFNDKCKWKTMGSAILGAGGAGVPLAPSQHSGRPWLLPPRGGVSRAWHAHTQHQQAVARAAWTPQSAGGDCWMPPACTGTPGLPVA